MLPSKFMLRILWQSGMTTTCYGIKFMPLQLYSGVATTELLIHPHVAFTHPLLTFPPVTHQTFSYPEIARTLQSEHVCELLNTTVISVMFHTT